MRLLELIDGLQEEPRASMFRWHDTVRDISRRLHCADAEQRARIADAVSELPLAEAVARARESDRCCCAARDLHTLVQRLACIVEALTVPRGAVLSLPELCVRYVRFDLAAFVRRTCSRFEGLASERGFAFSVTASDDLEIEADPDKTEVVLLNLLFNAFKHADPGGSIVCRLDTARDEIHLHVSDSGPGIPIQHAQSIFDAARQHDRSVCCAAPEVGFALASSREFTRLHGGDLTLCNPGDEGALFRAWWPASAPRGVPVGDRGVRGSPPPMTGVVPGSAGVGDRVLESTDLADRVVAVAARELRVEAAVELRRPSDCERPLVLIVDGSRAVQRTLAEGLEPRYAVACALDCVTGEALAAELLPDLVVIDAALEGTAGEQLIATLQSSTQLAEVPILALVTSWDAGTVVRFLESGVRDVLQKPFSRPELVARVDRMMHEKQSRELLNEIIGQHETDLLALANEVAEHQRSLQQALDEADRALHYAERASRTKSNFLRMMSHELKTPITAMALQMRVFEHEIGMVESPALGEGIGRMSRSLRRLTCLVDTVLEWARVETGRCQLRLEPIELEAVVRAVADEVRPYADRKGVRLEIAATSPAPPLYTDQKLLRLVLSNLATRAIQITEKGSVQFLVSGRADDIGVVTVVDGGPRVADSETSTLFEPVWTTGLHRHSGHGSGFGLHVMRDLVRALGGDLVLGDSSDRNQLEVCVPATEPPQPTTAEAAAGPA